MTDQNAEENMESNPSSGIGKITDHDRYYWQYEYDVVARFLLPLLRHWGIQPDGLRMLDVGCGDGGGLAAFHDAGVRCKGYDIEAPRVELALTMNGGREMDLRVGSVYVDPPFSGEKFDLVVLHDVFEHLDEKKKVLHTLSGYLSPTGRILITFPPFYSPYGGHQQLMRAPLARLPYIHLLPYVVNGLFPSLRNENQAFVEEIRKLTRLRMGMGKFERLAGESGLLIEARKAYLISPNHIRFGLRPVSSGFLARIPLIREMITSGVVYLLSAGR